MDVGVDEKRRKISKSTSALLEVQKTKNMRMALERVLIDMSRDMQDVGFYTGEYAAKKFEISRSMLPELYAGRGLFPCVCVVLNGSRVENMFSTDGAC